MRLTLYICLAGLALGIERIELEVEVMLRRFPGINRAARELFDRCVHLSTSTRSNLGGAQAGRAAASSLLGAGRRLTGVRVIRAVTGNPKAEEARAVPFGAGDFAGNGRE